MDCGDVRLILNPSMNTLTSLNLCNHNNRDTPVSQHSAHANTSMTPVTPVTPTGNHPIPAHATTTPLQNAGTHTQRNTDTATLCSPMDVHTVELPNVEKLVENYLGSVDLSTHKSVVNLSKFQLSLSHVSLLEKGLTFCPTLGETNMGQLKTDLDRFHRILRLRAFFDAQDERRQKNDAPQQKTQRNRTSA